VEADLHWPNPALSSASQKPAQFSGKSGVKMTGPYDFVAPSYWLVDTGRYGGAYGFNTETGPGPAIPTIYSLRKFLPADQMWPRGDDWNYHNGSESFTKLTVFDTAMNATYGEPHSLEQYERTAQTMAYDGERAMFEAYGRNKYTATGVVQWMLNNAWPSMIWHLYDYYLDAGGGYFGVRKACEPLHVQYSYDDHSIVVVNSEYQDAPSLRVQAAVYDLELKKVFSREASLDAPADSSSRAFLIPDDIFMANGQLHFVQLALVDATGKRISDNFYWVPAKLTEFDWSKTDFTHTPASSYEDLTALQTLPPAQVRAEILSSQKNPTGEVQVHLHNTSQALAFQLSVRALGGNGQALEPVFWSDNYICLMPGESRVLTARLSPRTGAARPADAFASDVIESVVVSGWNTPATTLHLHGAARMTAEGAGLP
jgi:exo-1,4-beta-D-glucosaminidase